MNENQRAQKKKRNDSIALFCAAQTDNTLDYVQGIYEQGRKYLTWRMRPCSGKEVEN